MSSEPIKFRNRVGKRQQTLPGSNFGPFLRMSNQVIGSDLSSSPLTIATFRSIQSSLIRSMTNLKTEAALNKFSKEILSSNFTNKEPAPITSVSGSKTLKRLVTLNELENLKQNPISITIKNSLKNFDNSVESTELQNITIRKSARMNTMKINVKPFKELDEVKVDENLRTQETINYPKQIKSMKNEEDNMILHKLRYHRQVKEFNINTNTENRILNSRSPRSLKELTENGLISNKSPADIRIRIRGNNTKRNQEVKDNSQECVQIESNTEPKHIQSKLKDSFKYSKPGAMNKWTWKGAKGLVK